MRSRPENPRNEFFDYLKGFLIFLVVWGYCVQYLGFGSKEFFWDPVFKLIYMFNMPLFMAVGGFIAWESIRKRSFVK